MTRRGARLTVFGALAALALASVAVPVTGGSAAAGVTDQDSSVSITKTITREHLVDGVDQEVDRRTVTLTVNRTQNLRSRQSVGVTWKGAHPSGNAVLSVNSSTAAGTEFPFVLMQCRGVDSTTVQISEQIRPETCWTQTATERMSESRASNPFRPWRVDRFAELADRAMRVNLPNPVPRPPICDNNATDAKRLVPFIARDGTVYYPDPAGAGFECTRQPPESLVNENASQPGNTTYGVTRADGTGETKFTMWTTQDNASLGCSQAIKCTLVAIPILGVSCDVAATGLPSVDRPSTVEAVAVGKDCMSAGNYPPGSFVAGAPGPALSVSGALWWSASNWRNRISVPLTFAPADNICDIVGAKEPVDLYGSELMAQAMIQWRPAFCLDATRTPFRHVQVGEPQAANLLAQSSVDASLVTYPPTGGYAKPVVNAPVAFTGFAVSYVIDDAQGVPVTNLRLTPRLIAKLLTMSYPGSSIVQGEYAALRDNPTDMSLDPEFQALNPGIKKGVANGYSASTIFSLSSDSDVISALTTYVNADKEARAWLDGTVDPWGMTVNPNYKALSLPVQTWPQLDTFQPLKFYTSGSDACLQNNPVPFLPLIAAPTSRMSGISFAMQFSVATSQVNCVVPTPGSTIGLKMVGGGAQSPGFRFVLGLTSLGDAARFSLDNAALQTGVAPGTAAKFTTDSGRTFVTPDEAGLNAAASLLTPNASTNSWDLPVASILNDDGAKAAYPGAMLVTAAVPTTGLPPAAAKAFAAVLEFAATTGQIAGTTNGTLPAGYLPITAANGMGNLATYASVAATAVANQKGVVPPLFPPAATPAQPVSPTPAARPGGAVLPPVPSGAANSTNATESTKATTAPTAAATSAPVPTRASAASKSKPSTVPTAGSGTPTSAASASAANTSAANTSAANTSGASPRGGSSVIAAPSSIAPPASVKVLPSPRAVSAVQPPQRFPTPAQVLGRLGSLAPVLILVAFGLGGLVPLMLTVRQVRGRRG